MICSCFLKEQIGFKLLNYLQVKVMVNQYSKINKVKHWTEKRVFTLIFTHLLGTSPVRLRCDKEEGNRTLSPWCLLCPSPLSNARPRPISLPGSRRLQNSLFNLCIYFFRHFDFSIILLIGRVPIPCICCMAALGK